jgi:asparagine synthase (glutamine-hydrolysing)
MSADFRDPTRSAAARDLLSTKIPRNLRFNDRMSMSRSRELRLPFLDHRIVEFGFSVPVRHCFDGDITKALFRKIAQRLIPSEVAYAKKREVQSPQREWLAECWRDMVFEILDSKSFSERGWVDAKRARGIYENYLAGDRSNSFYVWQWVNLELWARAFLDGWRGPVLAAR